MRGDKRCTFKWYVDLDESLETVSTNDVITTMAMDAHKWHIVAIMDALGVYLNTNNGKFV